MEIIDAILTRRTVRKFKAIPVPDELLDKVLQAAMAAPSTGNQQPWRFMVTRRRELLDVIPDFQPYSEMVRQAPVAVLVCCDMTLVRFKNFWLQDCCAAVENLLLAAHGLGLGAAWTAAYPEKSRMEGFRNLFHLPEEIIPLALVPIGFPEITPERVNRFNRTRIHYDQWVPVVDDDIEDIHE
jgi:nitroreductase